MPLWLKNISGFETHPGKLFKLNLQEIYFWMDMPFIKSKLIFAILLISIFSSLHERK